jgi:hypothetical protein
LHLKGEMCLEMKGGIWTGRECQISHCPYVTNEHSKLGQDAKSCDPFIPYTVLFTNMKMEEKWLIKSRVFHFIREKVE